MDVGTLRKGDLTRGNLLKDLIAFGLPLVAMMVFHGLFNLVDLGMVGHWLGTSAIAGVQIASQINMIPVVLCQGLSTATLAFVARGYGAGDDERAERFFRESLYFSALVGVLLGVPGVIYAEELMRLFTHDPEVLRHGVPNLAISNGGLVIVFLLMQIVAGMRSVGNSVGPLLILVLSNLANIVGNVVLIPGLGPIPALGAAGSAWATVGSRAAGALLGLVLLRSLREETRFRLLPVALGARTCLKLLRVGIPSSLQLVFRALAVLGLSWLCDAYGRDALAALSIGIRLETLVLFAAFGWGGAASTVVAQNLGAGKPRRAEIGSWLAAGLGAVMLGGIGALLFWKAGDTVALFDAHPAVVESGTWYLWILTPSYAFLTLGVALSQALNGAGSTRAALAIDALGLAVLLPAAWLLSRETPLGVKGIFAGAALTNVFLAGVYGLWFNTGRWKHKTLHL